MSRKHYIQFAEFIKNYGADRVEHDKTVNSIVRKDMAYMVAQIAKQDNPNFDRNRFFYACGVELN